MDYVVKLGSTMVTRLVYVMHYVNVCIHDFDDAKEESNKAASNDKHLLQE